MENVIKVREELYRILTPEGCPITLMVKSELINNDPPSGEEIMASVRGIHTVRSGGPSVMCAEHLNTWIREATQEKEPIRTRWEAVLIMIHLALWEVRIP